MVTKRPTPKKRAAKPREPKKRASLDPTLIADLVAIGRRIPAEDLAMIPRDASTRFDEYLEELLD
jgi:hypothetical protein